jgi:acetolactate synthase-1/2/3 large subunit
VSKRLLSEADLVIGLGTRFEEMETNWRPGFVPSPSARYIQVDIDAAEIGRSIPAAYGIVGDVKDVLFDLNGEVARSGRALSAGEFRTKAHVEACREELDRLDTDIANIAAGNETPIHPLKVFRAIRAIFPRESPVAIDVGCIAQHMGGSVPAFNIFEPRSLVVPSSFYGMGFAASGLPVAKLVYPDRPAVGFVGDGSFQMIMHVLPFAAEYGLAVTWCVFNDGALGSIRDIQEFSLKNRIIDTDYKIIPDFARVAEACGCYGERVVDPGDVRPAVERALAANRAGKPALLDFIVARARMPQTYEHYTFYGRA